MPQVTTILDLAFVHHPEGYGRVWRGFAWRGIGRLPRRPGRSYASRRRRRTTPSSSSARRASGSSSHTSDPARRRASPAQQPGRDFLYVGDAEARKNLDGLVAAYAAYRDVDDAPADLVLAGAASELATDAGPGVRGAGRPDPAALLELLRASARARAPGDPRGVRPHAARGDGGRNTVLAVRGEAVAEVTGDAALLVEPDGLAGGLARLAFDEALHARLRAAGPARAAGSAGTPRLGCTNRRMPKQPARPAERD